MKTPVYSVLRPSISEFVMVRGLRHHVRRWGPAHAPLLVALHGWMDQSATFQFLVDAWAGDWQVVAPDWRGFGLTGPSGADSYEFGDYLGDLDALLSRYTPDRPAVLLGHSMGGNLAMLYAGIRPDRVRGVVNLEGLGLPASAPEDAPGRYAQWLSQIARGGHLADYASLEAVADRLCRDNPRLTPDRALFLARHAAVRQGERWVWRADPAHRIVNRTLYRIDEVLACWRRIEAPVLWVEAAESAVRARMRAQPDYADRLAQVPALTRCDIGEAGHMLHHDQPAAVAARLAAFLGTLPRAPAVQ